VLEVRDLRVSYGAVPALHGVSLRVGPGEAVAVLGRNGAGKSTTLRGIAGLADVRGGSVVVDGKDITAMPAERRPGVGVTLVPEGRGVFPGLTVRENLVMGAYHRRLRAGAVAAELDRVTEHFPRLVERLDQRVGSLSGGEQQMVVLARALMARPRCLVLDEPSLGLAPLIVEYLYALLAELHATGMAVLVVEQYVEVALSFATRAYVLDKGRVVLEGGADELASSPELVSAYLDA
jgi:branched-chain amino acid transport system ATP-binding protein